MRLRALLVGLVIGALTPFAGPAVAVPSVVVAEPTPVARDLGIAATGTRLVWGEPAQVEQDLDRVAASGATWLRFDVAWTQLSWVRGQTDWARVDRVVSGAKARNLKVLGIVGTMAPWARPTGAAWNYGPRTDAERVAFAGFAQAAAARYAGRIDAWEVWNEPNLDQAWAPRPSAVDYQRLLASTYPAIKRACPECLVVSGGTGGAGGAPDVDTWTWYRDLYTAGGQRYFDALGVHPYTDLTSGYGGEMRLAFRIRHLMDANGDATKQMWATETGAPTAGLMSVAESDTPDLLRESVDSWQSIPRHGPLFWYTIADTQDTTREGHFGLFRTNGTAKPTYAAMQTLTSGAAVSTPRTSQPGTWTALPAQKAGVASRRDTVALGPAVRAAARAAVTLRAARATAQRATRLSKQAAVTARRHPTQRSRQRAAAARVAARRAGRAVTAAMARSTAAAAVLRAARLRAVRTGKAPVAAPAAAQALTPSVDDAVVVLRSGLTAQAGQTHAEVTLRTNGIVQARAVIVAVRGADGSNHDVWLERSAVLNGTQVFDGVRGRLPSGSYTYRVAYLGVDGVWNDLWPEQTVTIGAATPTVPTATVSQMSMTATSARVKGSFTLFTAGSIPVKNVIMAVRDAQGRSGYDALASFETTLSGYQTFFPSRTALRPGTYTYRVAYQTMDGRWSEVPSTKTLVAR